MPALTLVNENEGLLCVFVEPLGMDYWIAPKQKLTFTASASGPEVEVIWHSQGASIWVSDADVYGFVVTTSDGDEVPGGYQRPAGAFDHLRSHDQPGDDA